MSRPQLVDATYDAAERLNELKGRYGRISARRAREVSKRIHEAKRLRARLQQQDDEPDNAAAAQLKGEISRFSISTVCDKRELMWPRHLVNFHPLQIMRAAVGGLRR